MSAMKYHRRILMSSGAEETPHEKADPLGAAFECGEDVILLTIMHTIKSCSFYHAVLKILWKLHTKRFWFHVLIGQRPRTI